MLFCHFFLLLNIFALYACAKINPQTTHFTRSTSTKSSTSASSSPSPAPLPFELIAKRSSDAPAPTPPPSACCFVVQDVVSEEWWEISSMSSVYKVVNVSKITAHVSSWPGTTTTSYETNVQTTNASFSFSIEVGCNPISLFGNVAPHPSEVIQSNNGTALITGGVTVQSPAAFYVYSTVKVITAAAITDGAGNLACGTAIGGFPNMNQNAQAYFGGLDIPRLSLNLSGKIKQRAPVDVGVIITLATPFIYQPQRGKIGATDPGAACTETPGTEDYGYVPQTVLDFLVGHHEYSSQYPGLGSCLPAGPSIIPSGCGTAPIVVTFTTTFTSTPPPSTDIKNSTTFILSTKNITVAGSTIFSVTTILEASTLTSTIYRSGGETTSSFQSIFTSTFKNTTVVVTSTGQFTFTDTEVPVSTTTNTIVEETTSIAIETETQTTFSIISSELEQTAITIVQPAPTTVTSTGEITVPGGIGPVSAPTYMTAVGSDLTEITVVTATSPTVNPEPGGGVSGTVQASAQPPTQASPVQTSNPGSDPTSVAQDVCQIIGSCPTNTPGDPANSGASSSQVGVVVPNPTTIPVGAAPVGLPGQTTTIDGSTFIVVSTAITFAPSSSSPPDIIPGASVAIINGTPEIVIPSATNIPVVNAPPEVTGASTIMINNTPFLAITGPTTFAAPSAQPNGFTPTSTNVGGTLFLVIPSATNIPVANAPPGLTGSLTIIDGTPFIAVPAPTSIQVQGDPPVGTTSIVNGTPFLIIPGPTNIPLSNAPPGLQGTTTIIDGTTFLAVPSATQIVAPPVFSTTTINGTPFVTIPSATTIPLINAPPGLTGASTTIISGTPFLIIPSSTTFQLPTTLPNIPGAITTIINNMPFLIFPSATTIPVSLASGITGASTTIINGIPFVIIPNPTTIAQPGRQTSFPGSLTVIDGTTEVVITGSATIPVNSAFSISGFTTVISGITEVIVSGPTTVPLQTTASLAVSASFVSSIKSTFSSSQSSSSSIPSSDLSKSTTSSASSLTSHSPSAAQTPTATPSIQTNKKKGLSIGAEIGIAFAVLVALLAIIALIVFFARRRQKYTPVPPIIVSDGGGFGDGGNIPTPVRQMGVSYAPISSTAYAPLSQLRPFDEGD